MATEKRGLEEYLDLGNFPAVIAGLVFNLWHESSQGATPKEWLDQQAMCVAEEAGEFIKKYRKWRGFARTSATPEEVEDEMADTIISTACMMLLWSWFPDMDNGEPDPDAMRILIANKLQTILTRGYISKGNRAVQPSKYPSGHPEVSAGPMTGKTRDEAVAAYNRDSQNVANALNPIASIDPEHNPNGVYIRGNDGRYSYLGQAEAVDFSVLEPPYVVVLGKTISEVGRHMPPTAGHEVGCIRHTGDPGCTCSTSLYRLT